VVLAAIQHKRIIGIYCV